jgi:hypothetical protein
MNFYPARVLPLVSVAFLVSCGSSVKTDLEQMKNRGATRKEVQEKIVTIHQAPSGSMMTGVEAEKWIKNFCGGKIEEEGLILLESHGETLFFTTPNTTIFTFFNHDDKLVGYVLGTQ